MKTRVISVRVSEEIFDRVNYNAGRFYPKSYTNQPNRAQFLLDALNLFCDLAEAGSLDKVNLSQINIKDIVHPTTDSKEKVLEQIQQIQQSLQRIEQKLEQKRSLSKTHSYTEYTNEDEIVSSIHEYGTMNLNQAFELAKSRGFIGKKKTFSNNFSMHKEADYRFYNIGRVSQGKHKPALYFDDGDKFYTPDFSID